MDTAELLFALHNDPAKARLNLIDPDKATWTYKLLYGNTSAADGKDWSGIMVLSDLVMLLHLTAARTTFKSVAQVHSRHIEKAYESLASGISKYAARYAAKELATVIGTIIKEFIQSYRAEKLANEVEGAIRRNMTRAIKELDGMGWKDKRTGRKRPHKVVSTRHKLRKQRRPNGKAKVRKKKRREHHYKLGRKDKH